jgi:hypothetical protein
MFWQVAANGGSGASTRAQPGRCVPHRRQRRCAEILKAIDIALSPLSARAVAVLGGARFLLLTEVEPRGTPSVGALYYAVGYPNNRTLPFREDEPLRAKGFAVGAKTAPRKGIEKLA